MSQLEFKVTGMMCSGCSDSVKSIVGSLAIVDSISVDHESGHATVRMGGADGELVYSAIRDAGFGVRACGNTSCTCANCFGECRCRS